MYEVYHLVHLLWCFLINVFVCDNLYLHTKKVLITIKFNTCTLFKNSTRFYVAFFGFYILKFATITSNE